jgi:hypothetical protein
VSGTITTSGGAGKIIGGGRGIGIGGGGKAIAETGKKIINIKNNTFKINFFIGLPPLFIIFPTLYRTS